MAGCRFPCPQELLALPAVKVAMAAIEKASLQRKAPGND